MRRFEPRAYRAAPQAKPAKPVTPAAPTPQKRRFGLAPLAAALAALLVVVAGGAWWFVNASRPASVATKTPAEAVRLSIVVLPFANLSGDPAQDYLADALTDGLTTSLARIRDNFVIARNTAFTFKGKPVDAKAIGKDLGVRYVLEGSVQPSGDRSTPSSSTPAAAPTSGPNNSTRPAPTYLEAVGEEGDEDMGFDAPFVVMEDRADREVAFEGLERLLHRDELNVVLPDERRIAFGQIGSQQIAAFAAAGG